MTVRPILIVDDDPAVRDVVRQMLTLEGYAVVEAATGVEGVQPVAAARAAAGHPRYSHAEDEWSRSVGAHSPARRHARDDAHAQGRRRRQGARLRTRRGRLPVQALQQPRIDRARQGRAAPHLRTAVRSTNPPN